MYDPSRTQLCREWVLVPGGGQKVNLVGGIQPSDFSGHLYGVTGGGLTSRVLHLFLTRAMRGSGHILVLLMIFGLYPNDVLRRNIIPFKSWVSYFHSPRTTPPATRPCPSA